MKRMIGISLLLLAALAFTGCASLDGRNTDAEPWTQPFSRETGDPLAWPTSISSPAYEERQWLQSRQHTRP